MNILMDNRENSILILFAAATIGLGLGYESNNIIIAFADLLSIAALSLMLSYGITKEFTLIIISFFISFLTIIFASFNPDENFERSVLSLIYFYKPYLAFLLGYFLLNTQKKIEEFFLGYMLFSFPIMLIIFYKIIGKPYTADISYFFHPISIIGACGRNAYFVMVALSAMIGTIMLFRSSPTYKFYVGIYTIASTLLVFISKSRQSILALLIFYLLTGFKLLVSREKIQQQILLLTVFIGILIIFFSWNILLDLWGDKFSLATTSYFDLNNFSSNRLTIYNVLIQDIVESPYIGVAFKSLPSHMNEMTNYLISPHNQYLGAYWKMGLLPFVFYMLFLGVLYYGVWKLYKIKKDFFFYGIFLIISIILFVLAFFQDVLLTPLSGILFSLLCGSCLSILKSKDAIEVHRTFNFKLDKK